MRNDSSAWYFQVWISFLLALGTTSFGIFALPVNIWTRAFMGMGLVFTVGSTFSLAKTMRDKHESQRLIGRVSEAKTEKLLREYELSDVA